MTQLKHFTKDSRTFMFIMMGVSIIFLLIDSWITQGWITAAIWGYLLFAVYVFYAIITKDQFLKRLLIFTITAGFVELIADVFLVNTDTLIYPLDEPMLLKSPAYMPFSWAVVLMQMGYIGHLITDKIGWLKSGICVMLIGALMVPLYEKWAISSGWWYYQNVQEFHDVPLYVILAEGLLMLPIPYFVEKLKEGKSFLPSVGYGALEGVVMFIAAYVAFQLLA